MQLHCIAARSFVLLSEEYLDIRTSNENDDVNHGGEDGPEAHSVVGAPDVPQRSRKWFTSSYDLLVKQKLSILCDASLSAVLTMTNLLVEREISLMKPDIHLFGG